MKVVQMALLPEVLLGAVDAGNVLGAWCVQSWRGDGGLTIGGMPLVPRVVVLLTQGRGLVLGIVPATSVLGEALLAVWQGHR